MSLHRITLDTSPPPAGQSVTITGDEAWHAVMVKRVQAGDTVELLDGRGIVATAKITGTDKRKRDAQVSLMVLSVAIHPHLSPRVEVWSAVPKADRAAQMIDQLAQAGAAVWRPLISERSVTDPDHKADRIHRIATEASKQCGRPWHLALDTPRTIGDAAAWAVAHAPGSLLVADAEGQPATTFTASHLVVLVGPEGGFTAAELDTLRNAGAKTLRLGPYILRTETASPAAAIALLSR